MKVHKLLLINSSTDILLKLINIICINLKYYRDKPIKL